MSGFLMPANMQSVAFASDNGRFPMDDLKAWPSECVALCQHCDALGVWLADVSSVLKEILQYSPGDWRAAEGGKYMADLKGKDEALLVYCVQRPEGECLRPETHS